MISEAAAKAALAAHPSTSFTPNILQFWIDSMCMGLIIVLYHTYCKFFLKDDNRVLSYTVHFMFAYSCLYTIYDLTRAMHLFVYHFGDYAPFLETDWTSWVFLIEPFGRMPVSIFFCHRAYKLSNNSITLLGIVGVTFLGYIGGAIWSFITFRNGDPQDTRPTYVWIGCETAGDVVITGTIMYYLLKRKTGWKQTDDMIRKIAIILIESQLPPTIASIAYIFISAFAGEYRGFFTWTIKLYAIALFNVLNSRATLRAMADRRAAPGVYTGNNTYALSQLGKSSAGQIQVTTETYRHVDNEMSLASPRLPMHKEDEESQDPGAITVLDYSDSKTRLNRHVGFERV